MRNLKRALSLTLASVMLLGMMVVGSSAAAGYDDVADTDNVEAIEVLQAVEVMVGDERGFGPERPVNRAEMAVVMGKLLNLDYNYYEATCPFNDVYDWARGWVGACYANGIVSGRGEGVYDPGTTVTAVEAASMLMRALGYFKYQSDYAEGFEVATVKQANTIGLFDGVNSSTNAPLTRNQVAQMALNALRSGVVTADGNALNFIDANGNVIATGGKVNYVFVTSNKAFATAISSVRASSMGSTNDAPIVELGEQLYNGELRLNDQDVDVFQRPARTWEYKGEQVGTYVKKELLKQEYTAKVTGKDLYDLLTKNTIEEYAFTIAIDGETEKNVLDGYGYFTTGNLVRTNTKAVGNTGKGVLTQVFVDTLNEHVYIAVINTYLAKATKDYDTKREEATFKVWNLDQVSNRKALVKDGKTTELKVSIDEFEVSEVKKDDIVLVRVADNAIQEFITPEVISDTTISSFKRDDWVNNGTKYDYASTAMYDEEVLEDYNLINMKETTFNIYLDPYGYMIGLEANADPDQYVFLTGIDGALSNLYAKNVDANVIHMDGTMETVKVNLADSKDGSGRLLAGELNNRNLSQLNAWCTYSVNANGTYTLKLVPIADDVRVVNDGKDGRDKVKVAQYGQDVHVRDLSDSTDTKNIKEKRPSLFSFYKSMTSGEYGYVYGNDETVYLNVTLEDIKVDDDSKGGSLRRIIDDVESVTVGLKNVDIEVLDLKNTRGDGKVDTDPVKNTYLAPDAEIYTLYDVDGVVIAAVTIGKDNGTSSTWAYITSSTPTQEDYEHVTGTKTAKPGEWTWYRDAIVNGEKTQLIEVGDTLNYLGNKYNEGNMKQGQWYEIKYNADGYVRNAELLSTKLGYSFFVPNKDQDGKFMTEVNQVEPTMNRKDGSVILHKELADGNRLSLSYENGTLWTNTAQTEGFSVSPDVKVVVCLAELNKGYTDNPSLRRGIVSQFDTVTDGYTGYAGLETAIRDLDYNFFGDLSAIIENGRATTIIFNDCYGTYVDQGNSTVRGQYLDLYGNLYTDRFNDDRNQYAAIVTVDDGEVEPTSRGTDAYGAYTRYNIKPGAYVVIRDADIDTGAAFVTNITGRDYRVNNRNNTISFTMPTGTAFIDGFNQGIANDMVGVFDGDNTNLNNITATFNGKDEDKDIGVMEPGDPVDVVIKMNGARALTLKANTEYTVKIGDPVSAVTRTSTESATIEFTYRLTNNDIRRGEIVIWDITEGKGGEDPNPPQPGDKTISSVNPTLPAVTGIKVGDTLPEASAEKDANYDVETVWKDKDGNVVTKAEAAGDYTYTVTLKAKDGYKFADDVKTSFEGKATVTAEPAGDTTTEYVKIFGQWFEIVYDKDGNVLSTTKLDYDPTAPKTTARAAVVPEVPTDLENKLFSIQLGNVVFKFSIVDGQTELEFSGLVDPNKGFDLGEEKTGANGVKYREATNEKWLPAVTGDASFVGDKLSVKLGQPMDGYEFPTEIKVDDKATATIEWYEADGTTKVTESVAEAGKTYTYKVTGLKAAAENPVSADVVVTTEAGKSYSVSSYAFNKGVEIKTDGTMDTNSSIKDVTTDGSDKSFTEVVPGNGKSYTINWKASSGRPNAGEIKDLVLADLTAKGNNPAKADWASDTVGSDGYLKSNTANLNIKFGSESAADTTYIINLVKNTEVIYKGETKGYVTAGAAGLTGFAKNATLIGGGDAGVKAGKAITASAAGEISIPEAGSADYCYLFDAVIVKAPGGGTITHYNGVDANGDPVKTPWPTGYNAVKEGAVLYVQGNSGTSGKTISLMANEQVVAGPEKVREEPKTWTTKPIQIAWADKNGEIAFKETGENATVKLMDGDTVLQTVETSQGADLTLTVDKESSWLKVADGVKAATDATCTADSDGKLKILGASVDAKSVTFIRVYKLDVNGTNITADTVMAVKDVAKYTGKADLNGVKIIAMTSAGAPIYVAKGLDVCLTAAGVDTYLASEIPGFQREKALTDTTSGNKYVYSFPMPGDDVFAGDITKSAIIVAAADSSANTDHTLNRPGDVFKFNVGIKDAEAKADPTVSAAWYEDAKGTVISSAGKPAGIAEIKVEKNATAAEIDDSNSSPVTCTESWTITFKSGDASVVEPGTYYFGIELNGETVVVALTVTAWTVKDLSDLNKLIEATPAGGTIELASGNISNAVIPDDKTVSAKTGAVLNNPTVNGGTLVMKANNVVTGAVTLKDGKLVLDTAVTTLPTAITGTGTVVVNNTVGVDTALADLSTTLGGTKVDTAIKPTGSEKEVTANLAKAPIGLSGTSKLTNFSNKSLDEYLADDTALGGKKAESLSLYQYTLDATTYGAKYVVAHKSYDGGKTWVLMDANWNDGKTTVKGATGDNGVFLSLLADTVTTLRYTFYSAAVTPTATGAVVPDGTTLDGTVTINIG